MKTYVNLPNTETLEKLCEYSDDLCITITFPTVMKGPETEQNAIRLKNARQSLEEKLEAVDKKLRDFPELAKKMEELERDGPLWEHQEKGFCLLWSPKKSHIFQTPYSLPEKVIIDQHFYLKDLLLNQHQKNSFTVLSLNEEKIGLIKGCVNNVAMETIAMPPHMESFGAFLSAYDFEESLQFSTQGPAQKSRGAGDRTPHYHGQSVAQDDTKNRYREEFLKQVEDWSHETLNRLNADYNFMIGDERIIGLFKKIARDTYPETILLDYKNAKDIRPKDLMASIEQYFSNQKKSDEIDEVGRLARLNAGNEANLLFTLDQIALAAHNSRIETLIIANDFDNEYWGNIDTDNEEVNTDKTFNDVGCELINLAIINTVKNGGDLVSLDGVAGKRKLEKVDERFNDHKIAAICRW